MKDKQTKEHGGKLAVFGSRSVETIVCGEYILNFCVDFNPTEIITSAESGGVCETAREIAKICFIPLKVFFADTRRNAGKYHHRSVSVLTECDFCLFVHDGKSKGTLNEIEVCKKLKKPFKYVVIEPEPIEARGQAN